MFTGSLLVEITLSVESYVSVCMYLRLKTWGGVCNDLRTILLYEVAGVAALP